MSRIKVLPDLLVNKIAAGEVIERPASVVKELMENAIDAGSSQIKVAIEQGGRQLIRVSDDGMGMTAEELRLAVTPHATSKIEHEDDLFNIATMGFRGEALPSIGAVSNMRIVSRPRDQIEGAEILVSAERIESSQAAGCKPGTSVEVRDLFFNVPARRKFLKANATEVGHINEQFARIALAHRNVGFELNNNGRTTQNLPGGAGIVARLSALYGAEMAESLIPIERDERGLHIEAYVAPPAHSRSTGAWQYVFLNGRFIRDKFVQHAVREAYRGLMEHSRFPVVFMFLSIDPGLVDVNVHPTKIEVRWQDSNVVHSQVLAALREKFQQTDFTPAFRAGEASGGGGVGFGGSSRSAEPADADEARRHAASFFKDLEPRQPSDREGGYFTGMGAGEAERPVQPRPDEVSGRTWEALYGGGRESGDAGQRGDGFVGGGGDVSGAGSEAVGEAAGGAAASGGSRRAVQIHNTYLVTQCEDGMLIIDQHALHERIIYERLKNRIVSGPLESQRLLLPETMTVTPQQQALLNEHEDQLRQLGIEAEPFGADTIAIHAFPPILRNVDAVAFLRDLLDKLADKGESTHTEIVIHELLDMMSCKAAVKAGDPLSPEEIDSLISQKELVEKSSNCPHGRPTTLRMTISDLEKQFKRK